MNIVIWARISSREQKEGYSLDAQLRADRDRAASNGWRVVREFVVAESAKVRTRSKSLVHLADKLAAATDPQDVYVFHAQAPDIDEFLERVTKIVPRDRIEVGEIGPVIGTHAGPRTIGLGWVDAP